MPKPERERAAALGRAMSLERALTRELDDILSSAKSLFPKLQARRSSVVAELAGVDAALARLTEFGGTPPEKSADIAAPTRGRTGPTRRRSVSPSKRARKRRASGWRTLSDVVIETLTDKGALGLSELSCAIASQHSASVSGLPCLLWELKKRGLIQVERTRGSFRYSSVRSR